MSGTAAATSTHAAVALARALLQRRSVTPEDDGALSILGEALTALGFTTHRVDFNSTPNLYARRGKAGPHLCFAGHTDVVPPGEGWSSDPFGAVLRDGRLFGRGACDMKGAIAAFVAAAGEARETGSLSLLITGDEEGPATDGTVRVLEWMAARGEIPDFCLVGEPTNPATLGEVIKIGRRGSLSASIEIRGRQGHVAYPQRADNPVHRLIASLATLIGHRLDEGTEWFEPSSLQVTSVDVGNPTTNVIPARAEARLNIRFNDRHTGASLAEWLRSVVAATASEATVSVSISGDAFRTEPGPAVEALRRAVAAETGCEPRLDTGGGTSDARFIARYCPVAEFGLVGATMHQVDESVAVQDLVTLSAVYGRFIEEFMA